MSLVLNELVHLLTKMQRFDAASAVKLFEGGAISEEECRDTLLGIQTQMSSHEGEGEDKNKRSFYYLEFSGGKHLIFINEIRTVEKVSQWHDKLEDEVYGMILNKNFPASENVRDLMLWYGTEDDRDQAYTGLTSWMTTLGPVQIKQIDQQTI